MNNPRSNVLTRTKAQNDSRKVDELLQSVGRAAQGDLTCSIKVEGDEPIDLLAEGIKKMIQDLRAVIGEVVNAAGGLSGSSQTIAGPIDVTNPSPIAPT